MPFAYASNRLCLHEHNMLNGEKREFTMEEFPMLDELKKYDVLIDKCSIQRAYLEEVVASDIYLGLFGERYGFEDAEGISPTEREYDAATLHNLYRIVLVKDVPTRHDKELQLIGKAEQDVVRNMFGTYDELQERVYSALACDKRKFPLVYREENIPRILNGALHLVSDEGRVTNAALLLFAKDPQKWFVSSVVKCAQFYGTEPVKPIPFQQIYSGSVFEIVDQAVAFVMTHIDARVSDRSKSAQADIEYELPVQAVTEAIVNAVVHSDYTSTGAVQVMLFRDRLEVWNPGGLPKGLTVEKLQGHHRSMPANPLLATPVYLAGYIEQIGTGTTDLIDRCLAYGLPRPTFKQEDDFLLTIYRSTPQDALQDTTQDTPQVIRVYRAVGDRALNKQQIMTILGLEDRVHFRLTYLQPALDAGLLEMTIPDKPTSKNQKYRVTKKGRDMNL